MIDLRLDSHAPDVSGSKDPFPKGQTRGGKGSTSWGMCYVRSNGLSPMTFLLNGTGHSNRLLAARDRLVGNERGGQADETQPATPPRTSHTTAQPAPSLNVIVMQGKTTHGPSPSAL
jgi:hypothetical protein